GSGGKCDPGPDLHELTPIGAKNSGQHHNPTPTAVNPDGGGSVLTQPAPVPAGAPVGMWQVGDRIPAPGHHASPPLTVRSCTAWAAMRAQSISDSHAVLTRRGVPPSAISKPAPGLPGSIAFAVYPCDAQPCPSTMSEDTSVVQRPANRHANRSR